MLKRPDNSLPKPTQDDPVEQVRSQMAPVYLLLTPAKPTKLAEPGVIPEVIYKG